MDSTLVCDLCKMSFLNQSTWETHINGKKHTRKVGLSTVKSIEGLITASESSIICEICKFTADSIVAWNTHIKGAAHTKSLRKYQSEKQHRSSVISDRSQVSEELNRPQPSSDRHNDNSAIDPNDIYPRAYQLEILEVAVKHNTLAFLPTGR